MRISIVGTLALMLVACGEPGEVLADAGGEPAKSVMETEAEKVCAEMTGFRADALPGQPAEIQAKLRREFDLCVTSVATEEATPGDAPALRGRTTAP